jgi:hypothetical protein
MADDWRQHVWQPGERDAALASIAERRERNAEELPPRPTSPAPTVIRKTRPISSSAAAATAREAETWADWIEQRIKRRADRDMRISTKAIAAVLIEQERARQAVEAELRAELASLRERIAALETRSSAPAIRAVG